MKKANTQKATVSPALKGFKSAWTRGRTADQAMHKYLCEMLINFTKTDRNTTELTQAITHMIVKDRSYHSTQAICTTLGKYGFTVTGHKQDNDEIKVKCRKNKTYDEKWLAECKALPWYTVARQMQKARDWSDPENKVIRDYAVGVLMGKTNMKALRGMFTTDMCAKIQTATQDQDLITTVQERMSKLAEQAKKEAA